MGRHRRPNPRRSSWLVSPLAAVLGALAFAVLLSGCSGPPRDGLMKQAGQSVTRDTQPWYVRLGDAAG